MNDFGILSIILGTISLIIAIILKPNTKTKKK